MKVIISGYYGFGNIGDEAILEAITRGLQPCEITRDWRDFDVFISGGGTLFQDATSSRSFWYYIGQVLLAKLLGKKVMVFAQGFGPLRGSFNRWLARVVLNQVDLITLRDEDALQALTQLGVDRPERAVTADPAFLLAPPVVEEGKKILDLEAVPSDRPLLGVAVRSTSFPPQAEDQFFRALAEGLDQLVKKYSFRPVFLLFQSPEDMRATSKVMRAMQENSHVIFRRCRPQEMLDIISRLDFMIGMRLHSLIFAAMNHVPMLGISYDPKVEAFMNSIGQPCIGIDSPHLSVGNIISQQLEEILSRKESIRKDLEGKKSMLRDRAKLNFDLFFKKFGEVKTA